MCCVPTPASTCLPWCRAEDGAVPCTGGRAEGGGPGHRRQPPEHASAAVQGAAARHEVVLNVLDLRLVPENDLMTKP